MKSFTIVNLIMALLGPVMSEQLSRSNYYDACKTPLGQSGICINIKRCPELTKVLQQKPLTQQHINFLLARQCGYEGSSPKVCCEQNNEEQQIPISTPRPTPSWNRPQTPPNSDPQAPDVTNHPNLRLLDLNNCGPFTDDRIVGGNVTGIQEFPWMALLVYYTGRKFPDFQCGGSVINERYVLTAAHCVVNLKPSMKLVGVRVGEHNIYEERDCAYVGTEQEYCNDRYQDFAIEQLIQHPAYVSTTLMNDIALLRLNRKIDFKPANAKHICLPVGTAAKLPKQKFTITGWGMTDWKREPSAVMMKAFIPHVPQEQCGTIYKPNVTISYKQICAGGEYGVDACSGDSGGPLQAPTVYNDKPRYIQYGIVSFGSSKCGKDIYPGVFTRVDYYLDWILNNMKH